MRLEWPLWWLKQNLHELNHWIWLRKFLLEAVNIFLEQHLILIHKTLVIELVLWFILFHVETCVLHLSWIFQPPTLAYLSARPNSSLADLQRSPALESKLTSSPQPKLALHIATQTFLQWLSLSWLKGAALGFHSVRRQQTWGFSVVLIGQVNDRYPDQLPLKFIKLLLFGGGIKNKDHCSFPSLTSS